MKHFLEMLANLFFVLQVECLVIHLKLGPHLSAARYAMINDYDFLRLENERFKTLHVADKKQLASAFIFLAHFDCYVPLGNTADLIIWDRVDIGQMTFFGEGHIVNHDLYTLRGRAVWALENIVGTDLETIRGNISDEELITNLQRVSTATKCYFNGYNDAIMNAQNKPKPE